MLEDPRIETARKLWAFSWVFYTCYVMALMGLSHGLGVFPLVWGLPRWIAMGHVLCPMLFVVLLIILIERLVPEIDFDPWLNENPSP